MTQKERWASRFGLVLAMAGNAVGLGNFLRFPAQTVKNGGGAFLIPYFVALLLVGLPLIWVEWAMGRFGGQLGHHSTPGMFDVMGRSRVWKYLGVFGLFSNLMIAAFYLYIESWTMAYAGHSLLGGFANETGEAFLARLTGEESKQIWAVSGFGMAIFAACVLINIFILSKGLAAGIELVSKIGMPLLIVFAAILAVRGLMITPESDPNAKTSAMTGLNFLWEPKYDSLADPAVWLAAAGQIFFTLGVGIGAVHCYASYVTDKDDITLTGATAAWTNEFCEVILGGCILIPIAVAYLGLDGVRDATAGGSGFSLGFNVFPSLFQNWGAFARPAGFMWFGLLFFAAITSSLAMGQPIMAFLQDEFGFSRVRSAAAFGAMLVPLALPVALLHSKTFFDEFDYWCGTLALVVFAFIESLLFAWVFGMDRGWQEIMKGADLRVPGVFYPIIRFVTPLFLALVLLAYVFKPAAGWEAYVAAVTGKGEAPPWEWAGDGMIGRLLHRDLIPADSATDDERRFLETVRLFRNGDRVTMVAVFAGFSALVWIAWRRRARGESPGVRF